MMDKDGSPLHNLQSVSDVKIVYNNYMYQEFKLVTQRHFKFKLSPHSPARKKL